VTLDNTVVDWEHLNVLGGKGAGAFLKPPVRRVEVVHCTFYSSGREPVARKRRRSAAALHPALGNTEARRRVRKAATSKGLVLECLQGGGGTAGRTLSVVQRRKSCES
jgi:hypothetical protein